MQDREQEFPERTPIRFAVELKEIDSEDLAPVAELDRVLWCASAESDHYLDYYRSMLATPWSQSHVRVMALTHGARLLSSFKLYTLDFRISGHHYRTAGIGSLATFPEHRGQGHATHMLKAALSALRASYQIAILFSDINPLFFARLGFAHVPTAHYLYDTTHASVHLAPAPPVPEALIRSALDIDLEDVLPIYQSVSPSVPISAMRDIWFWRHRLEIGRMRERLLGLPRDSYRLMVFGEPGNVEAYMFLSCQPECWTVEEVAGFSGEPLSCLVEWVLREARARRIPRVSLPVHGRARPAWGSPQETASGEAALMIHPLASSLDLDALDRPECNLIWKTDRF